MPITKTQRWLDLITFLAKRRYPVTVEDLMKGVAGYAETWKEGDATAQASARRKFERDKDELRKAGIPVETRPHRVDGEETQGYVLAARDFYLPYLKLVGADAPRGASPPGGMALELTPDDARLAMDALRRVAELPDSPFAAEARSALAKLRFDLEPPAPEHRAPKHDVLAREAPAAFEREPVIFADGMGTGGVRDVLRRLTEALRSRRRVRFAYHGIFRGEATMRDVAPYGLLYQHGHWYLIGHDASRDAVRTFRLGRMEDVEAGPEGGYEHDPTFRLAAHVGREPWELGDDDPVHVDVRFAFPLSLWAERNDHGEEVERVPGGAVVRRFAVRQTDPLLRWLQAFGGDAVIVAPPELRRAQAALAARTVALYDGAGAGPGAGPGSGSHG